MGDMKNQTLPIESDVPESFGSKFGRQITGILCGLDRVRFRATRRLLFQPSAMEAYLQACGVLMKHFKPFAEKITQ
ncbi:MAG: hypothetical protein LBK99_03250, partial [Opitutaceae bacterium]|nr:hypothetical protein [Opitutaceae bacterium]